MSYPKDIKDCAKGPAKGGLKVTELKKLATEMGINTKGLKKAEICKEMEKLLTLPKKPNIPYEFKYDPDDDLYDIGEQLRLGYLTKEEAQDMVDEGWYKTLTYKGMLFQNKRMPYDDLSDDELRQEGMMQSTDFLWYYDVKDKMLISEPYYYPEYDHENDDEDYDDKYYESVYIPKLPKDDPSKGLYYLHVFSK